MKAERVVSKQGQVQPLNPMYFELRDWETQPRAVRPQARTSTGTSQQRARRMYVSWQPQVEGILTWIHVYHSISPYRLFIWEIFSRPASVKSWVPNFNLQFLLLDREDDKIEGKADRTAKGYEFICAIFRLDKTGLHQGLEKDEWYNFFSPARKHSKMHGTEPRYKSYNEILMITNTVHSVNVKYTSIWRVNVRMW